MATVGSVETIVEIRLTTTGVAWHADIEAQGTDHLRVRLRADDMGVLPVFAPGTSLECMLHGSDGRYYVDATVLTQKDALLWLRLPPVWLKQERRGATRTSGGFTVAYECEGRGGVAACINLSCGGMRVRLKSALPVRTKLELAFTLPGESLPVRTQAMVLHVYPQDEIASGVDHGVKFIGLTPGEGARIARYCGG